MAEAENNNQNEQRNDGDANKKKNEQASAGAKTTQEVRDAHYHEKGVKADGTGGKE